MSVIRPVIRYGPSRVISMAGSRRPCQSVRSRSSGPLAPLAPLAPPGVPGGLGGLGSAKAMLSAPDGQSRTARMISSIRPPLGATNGSWLVRNTVLSRSVHKPECWQMPRLSKIVTCSPW